MYYDTPDRAHLCLTEVVIEETHKRSVERSKLHYSPEVEVALFPSPQETGTGTSTITKSHELIHHDNSYSDNAQGCYKQLPADEIGVHQSWKGQRNWPHTNNISRIVDLRIKIKAP